MKITKCDLMLTGCLVVLVCVGLFFAWIIISDADPDQPEPDQKIYESIPYESRSYVDAMKMAAQYSPAVKLTVRTGDGQVWTFECIRLAIGVESGFIWLRDCQGRLHGLTIRTGIDYMMTEADTTCECE